MTIFFFIFQELKCQCIINLEIKVIIYPKIKIFFLFYFKDKMYLLHDTILLRSSKIVIDNKIIFPSRYLMCIVLFLIINVGNKILSKKNFLIDYFIYELVLTN